MGGVAGQLASNWTKWRQRKLIREKKNPHLRSVLNRTCLVFITQITCATHADVFAFRNCTFQPQIVPLSVFMTRHASLYKFVSMRIVTCMSVT